MLPLIYSIVGVAAITWVAFSLGINAACAGFLYLVCVVFAAAWGGFWAGTLTSMFAAICLDYFFFPPIFHFDINDPMDWVALGAFEFTAVVISELQHRAQVNASKAVAEQAATERLYQAAREILLLDQLGNPTPRILELIQQIFCLQGVTLFEPALAGFVRSGTCPTAMDEGAREAFAQNSIVYDPRKGIWCGALRAGTLVIGGLALHGPGILPLTAEAIASLCAVSIARIRALENEARAEAARQVEQMRTAVLEALAHQIKTPLCVIQAASSGLPALGQLSEPQQDLATAIDEQANRLNDLISRLLGTAALDSSEIKPRLAPVLLSTLMAAVVDHIPDQAQRKRVQVVVAGDEQPILADGQLMVTALGELIDNALKYSVPGTQITATVASEHAGVSLNVCNRGPVIALADRARIFERFYRTQDVQGKISGTGLGLSIVKRIAEAHHGRVSLESDAEKGTVFTVTVPTAA
jgi:two-component system sensor histidine kinase KdpD